MIRVLFFGKFSDMVADPEGLAFEPDQVQTVADVVTRIAEIDPRLHREITSGQVLTAVNQNLVGPETVLADGDEVAFLPPVTGG